MTDAKILEALEYVDCEYCRQIGKYRVVGPNTVECQCGCRYGIGPCACPASITGNPIDCGGCEEHAGEDNHG